MKDQAFARYWRSNLICLGALLAIWFAVSFGAGVLWVDALNGIALGGFKLGFWFAQQGSIYTFVALIFVYALVMQRLERRYRDERAAEAAGAVEAERTAEVADTADPQTQTKPRARED